jgi:hypothetical protein
LPLVSIPVPAAASGVTEGTATLDAETLRALVDGLVYVNIHTAQHVGGEIRGQVQSLP